MKISKKILNFLEEKKIKYEPVEHRIVYTAYDKAATLKVEPKMIGKTLVVKFDRNYGLVLIDADKILDIVKLSAFAKGYGGSTVAPTSRSEGGKKTNKIKSIQFVKESWMKKNLKEVQAGAIPPFGSLWKLPTFVDKALLKNKKIIVNGGDYNSSIKISSIDLKKIGDLVEGNFGKKKPKKIKKKLKKIAKRKRK